MGKMKSENITSVVITIIFVIALFIAFLATEKEVEELKIEMKALQQQKQELQIEYEEIEKEIERETIHPEEINCKTEMKEGDIRVRITVELYNPFGEWLEITEENAEYQIKNGARVINCK